MPKTIPIADLSAPELNAYARLTEAQLRAHEGLFIAETPQVIECALNAGYAPVSFLIDEEHVTGPARALLERCPDAPVYVGSASVVAQLTGYALTRGVLCAFRRPETPRPEAVLKGARRAAVLDGIADPSNLGAIFRSAAALGMDAVLLTPSCAAPLYRRGVRVSMGTVFQIPRARMGADWIDFLKSQGFKLAAMALNADSMPVSEPALKRENRLAIILGNEGKGLSEGVLARCDYTVLIPMRRGVDSLNVAAASAIAFWETALRFPAET